MKLTDDDEPFVEDFYFSTSEEGEDFYDEEEGEEGEEDEGEEGEDEEALGDGEAGDDEELGEEEADSEDSDGFIRGGSGAPAPRIVTARQLSLVAQRQAEAKARRWAAGGLSGL